jgi:integrase
MTPTPPNSHYQEWLKRGIFRRRGSRNLWVQYGHRGKKYRESCNSPSMKVAEALLRKRLGEIGQGRVVGPAIERIGVDELLEDMLAEYRIHGRPSLGTLQGHVKALMPRLGRLRAVDLTTTHLRGVIEDWQRDGVAPATINKRMTSLRRALNLGQQATPPKVLQVPHFPRLPEHNARQGFCEWSTFVAVLAALPDDGLRDFAEFAGRTAMRKAEIGKLSWQGYDRETGVLRLPGRDSKTGQLRRIVLDGPLQDLIARRLEARREHPECPYIFHRGGRPIREFRKSWRTACRRAGVAGLRFHDLRRTAIRNMVRAGVSQKVAMAISGHQTDHVFRRYDITSDDDLRQAMERTTTYLAMERTTTYLEGVATSPNKVVPIRGR